MEEFDDDIAEIINSSDALLQHLYCLLQTMIESSAHQNDKKKSFDGNLLERDVKYLKEFCEQNHISTISQAIAEFVSYLEWNNENNSVEIRETSIYNALLRLEKYLKNTSSWEIMGQDDVDGPLINLSDFEINMLEQAISLYLTKIFDENKSNACFFPLDKLYESDAIVKWRIFEKISVIKLTPDKPIYKYKLTEYITKKIKNDIETWLEKEFAKLNMDKTSLYKDIENLTNIINNIEAEVTITIKKVETGFFQIEGCDYLEIMVETVDEKLYTTCQKLMKSMEIYQTSHKHFHVNMRESCAISISLYREMKKLVHLFKEQVKIKSPLKIWNYINLFGELFLNLLHVLQSECLGRIQRAVELESNDSIQGEEKILTSSVLVLNCFCTIKDEWKQLEIEDQQLQLAYLVKITDIICDGAKMYAEALDRRLIVMDNKFKNPEYIKKVCYLTNSIHHVRQYLLNLPQQSEWCLCFDHFDNDENNLGPADQIQRILKLIHDSMDTHLRNIERKLIEQIISNIHLQIEKQLGVWLHTPVLTQNMGKLYIALNENLGPLHANLKEDLFTQFLSFFWISLLMFIKNRFQEGQPPEYAKTLKQNLEDLKKFFFYNNVEETHTSVYDQVSEMLAMNSKTTVELELAYYSECAELVISPTEYLGHIAFQAGFKSTTRELVDLYINVQKGQRLPVRKYEISELYVKVELCPNTLFPNTLPMKSSQPVIEGLDNPLFNELFHFPNLPRSVLDIKGAVAQVLVVNQDSSYNAEAVLLLNQVQDMSGLVSIEFVPVYLMPLRKFDKSHTSFQILESRSRWDRSAKLFISKRAKLSKRPKSSLTCLPGKKGACL